MQSNSSVVGVRASWTCAECRAIERTYQIMKLTHWEPLAIPPGWSLRENGSSVCRTHTLELEAGKETGN